MSDPQWTAACEGSQHAEYCRICLLWVRKINMYRCLQPTTTTIVLRPFAGTTRVSWYQKKHLPTHHTDHHPTFISFFHLLRYIASSLFKLRACQSFAQALFPSSLVYLFVWSSRPHIPYISSPKSVSLFTTHAHTIATCFAVVARLYHLLERPAVDAHWPTAPSLPLSCACHAMTTPSQPQLRCPYKAPTSITHWFLVFLSTPYLELCLLP